MHGSTTHSRINQAAPSPKFMIIAESTGKNIFRAGNEEKDDLDKEIQRPIEFVSLMRGRADGLVSLSLSR